MFHKLLDTEHKGASNEQRLLDIHTQYQHYPNIIQENEALLIHFYLYEISYFSQVQKNCNFRKNLVPGILGRSKSWQLICLPVQNWQTDTQARISLWINNARLQVARRKVIGKAEKNVSCT